MEEIARQITSVILGISFIWIGIQHFRDPEWFEPIVPSVLGNPKFWVYSSGIFEIILGIGVIIPNTQKISALSMSIMLVLLYWANLNMWINDIPIGGSKLSQTGHLVRGLIQFILIIIFLWIGKWFPFSAKSN
ncbi:MAG: hypothetical protein CL993_03910 [Euryarchaeota archaeon]|nr:hypothetical protein [Euryarchaeota archaeon]|tara:strand:- start:526 stop:924 length:399 start_codon:yes stop_codon:yes gene_type:complete